MVSFLVYWKEHWADVKGILILVPSLFLNSYGALDKSFVLFWI